MEKKFNFKPFDKVLVRDLDSQVWMARTFECMIGKMYHTTEGYDFRQCIPYNEETKHLHRTTDPYEPPYEPKKGDFVIIEGGIHSYLYIGIYSEIKGEHIHTLAAYNKDTGVLCWTEDVFCIGSKIIKKATEKEKQFLLDKMHEAGKDWDAEKMQVVGYKWKPKIGEDIYRPMISYAHFVPYSDIWSNSDCQPLCYQKGWIFKTEAECQTLCDELNEAIKNVK